MNDRGSFHLNDVFSQAGLHKARQTYTHAYMYMYSTLHLGSSLGKSIHLERRRSWVRILPEAARKWLPWVCCVVLCCAVFLRVSELELSCMHYILFYIASCIVWYFHTCSLFQTNLWV